MFWLESKPIRGPEIHRYHRNDANLLHRSKQHPKGLAYVSGRMIAGPLVSRWGRREDRLPDNRVAALPELGRGPRDVGPELLARPAHDPDERTAPPPLPGKWIGRLVALSAPAPEVPTEWADTGPAGMGGIDPATGPGIGDLNRACMPGPGRSREGT